ncbi:MAG: diguanylate cyclase, partial [Oscillospiraceae bacterium]
EFLVVIKNVENRSQVEKTVQELCSNANSEFYFGDSAFLLSISVGIAFFDNGTSYQDVFLAADKALYDVKRDKKNGYKFAN